MPDNVVLLDDQCSPEHNGVWYVGIRGYIHEARTAKANYETSKIYKCHLQHSSERPRLGRDMQSLCKVF